MDIDELEFWATVTDAYIAAQQKMIEGLGKR